MFICIIKNLELSLGCVFISNVVFIHFIKVKKVRCKTKVSGTKRFGELKFIMNNLRGFFLQHLLMTQQGETKGF